MIRFLFIVCFFISFKTLSNEVVNIYSYRQASLIEPLLSDFTKKTGIKTKVFFAKEGLAERLKREGKLSPADVILTNGIADIVYLSRLGLTQAVDSDLLKNRLKQQYFDPELHWFALTQRARLIFVRKSQNKNRSIRYLDLASKDLGGKICTRPFLHPYNVSLVADILYHHGEEKTVAWLKGVKANLARKPQGGDRDQIKALASGLCDYSIGNSYYYELMLDDEKQKVFASKVEHLFPDQKDYGTHVNVSGMMMAKYAKNKQNALKLMSFLVSDEAQLLFAKVNHEYPVVKDLDISSLSNSLPLFKIDETSLLEIGNLNNKAIALIKQVQFDL